MRNLLKVFLITVLLTNVSNVSHGQGPGPAQYLEPNQDQELFLTPVTVGTEPSLRGTIIYDKLIPFECGTSKGYLQDRVVKSRSSGKLHFYSGIRQISGSDIKTVERQSFPKRVLVGFRTDGIGFIGPQKVFRIIGKMDHIVFDFDGNATAPGDKSRLFFMMSTANNYKLTGYTTLTNYEGKSVSIQTAQPVW